ncbi:MAG TPA: HPr family phosphocarrier protein, partial [Gemmataceae bacterium]|nr:HPr family phosphocarrier protein [Gemmataceae bacterium]
CTVSECMSGSLRRVVTIANPHGLHMRPAAALAELASRFESAITVSRDRQAVDAKNWMDLLLLAAEGGTQVVIEATGKDAQQAVEALAEFLQTYRAAPDESSVPPQG